MRTLIILTISALVCGVFASECPQDLCADTETCCNGPRQGLYGCCPSPNAVCCTDGLHCCPTNTVCNLEAGTCDQNVLIPVIFRKKMIDRPAHKSVEVFKAENIDTVVCPGGQQICQDGTTCCPLPNGGYGCCPYVNAVCCQDHQHCCPAGTHCDSTSMWCLTGEDKFRSILKRPAAPATLKVETVVCPGGQQSCQDGTTCCPLPQGGYGCCPYVNAVCCQDHQHCCPAGTHCDSTSMWCLSGNDKFRSLFKTPATAIEQEAKVETVVCPGGQQSCQDGTTCCPLPNGGYGCCPYVNAVCCQDHQHCCPAGTHCDSTSMWCLSGEDKFQSLLKRPASPVA